MLSLSRSRGDAPGRILTPVSVAVLEDRSWAMLSCFAHAVK